MSETEMLKQRYDKLDVLESIVQNQNASERAIHAIAMFDLALKEMARLNHNYVFMLENTLNSYKNWAGAGMAREWLQTREDAIVHINRHNLSGDWSDYSIDIVWGDHKEYRQHFQTDDYKIWCRMQRLYQYKQHRQDFLYRWLKYPNFQKAYTSPSNFNIITCNGYTIL